MRKKNQIYTKFGMLHEHSKILIQSYLNVLLILLVWSLFELTIIPLITDIRNIIAIYLFSHRLYKRIYGVCLQ